MRSVRYKPREDILPVVLLAGPTGVGKTALSLRLASEWNGEIVNADSMQVYKLMDIGSAKPTPEERAQAPHHLIDVVAPDEPFDAGRYAETARPVVDELLRRGKIPLVVGGTGLYMKALLHGVCPGAPGSEEVKEELRRELEERGLDELHAELGRVDPRAARRIHPNDRQRILRALEVYRLTGAPLTEWQERHGFQDAPYRRVVKIFLHRDREELYARIDARVHLMLEQGFIEEVRRLLEMGYGPELKPMQSLGYRQATQYILGNTTLEEAVRQIQQETRRYAKRQMTWFRADPEFQWIDPDAAMREPPECFREVRAAARKMLGRSESRQYR
jgi:tRNA dimethylallyltransferase